MSKSTKDKQPAQPITISDARMEYVSNLPKDKRKADMDMQLKEFAEWLDSTGQRLVNDVRAGEIGEYAEEHYNRTSLPDHAMLREIKGFLSYLHRKGHSNGNLSINIRVTRGGRAAAKATTLRKHEVQLTKEGHDLLVRQRDSLQKEKVRIVEEIERAAADGDFRENAPLDAAREEHARISNKLAETEETLQMAVIIDESASGASVRVGSKLELTNLDINVKYKCQIVAPKEADPLKDKISTASPVGAALLNAKTGAEVTVRLPKGSIRYRVESIS